MNKSDYEKLLPALFFVYGTLKKSYYNHRVIEHPTTKFLGEVKTEPIYTLFTGSYPVVERNGNTSITGELYEVNDINVMTNIFGLEGSSPVQHSPLNWYDWDFIDTPNGKARIFVMDKGDSGRTKVVESGIWH